MAVRARIDVGDSPVQFLRRAEQLRHDTEAAVRDLGERAELIYAAHAPHATGRLARGISSQAQGLSAVVRADARNPQSGYDYVGVTRFGHRQARLYAKHAPATVLATGKARVGVLRFTIGGRVFYRRSVKAYHPLQDWSQRAMPQIRAQADRTMAELGRKIELSGL